MREIRVSALILTNSAGEVLNVRKHGTDMFLFPGGKPEPGESALETVVREIAEEISLTLDPTLLTYLGEYRAPAANEAGFDVVADVFSYPPTAESPIPAAEIAEMRWVDPAAEFTADLAPLSCNLIATHLR